MKWLALLLLPAFSFSQTKVDGLGPFKIGKSLSSQLPTYGDTSRGRLYYATPDQPNTEMWFAGYYPIADMWIEDLQLTFFNDTLYKIQCKVSLKLKEAMELKYGAGVTKSTANVVNCITGLKIKYEENEKNYTVTWPGASKNISAVQEMSITLDDHCQKSYSNTLSISNMATAYRVYALNDKADEKKRNAEIEKRKKALSGF